MYGWSDDSTPTNSINANDYDYSAARSAYSRSYAPSAPAVSAANAAGSKISTQSPHPMLIRIDVTGSNKANAFTFFDKLPLLYSQAVKYLPDLAISFGAVGDARSDSYPLQVRDFKAGEDLDAELKALYPEGNGGGQGTESYELAALYDLHNCEMPNASLPFWFLLCDEGAVDVAEVHYAASVAGVNIEGNMSVDEIFKQLRQKYNVYVLHSHYDSGNDAAIVEQWKQLVGAEKVRILDDPARVVDVILGIIALKTQKFDAFKAELTQRQTSAQVTSVLKTLRPDILQAKATAAAGGKSRTFAKDPADNGKTSKPLIDADDSGKAGKTSKPLV